MSSQSPSHPTTSGPPEHGQVDPAEVARLKRRLAAAQEEVKELSGTKPKKIPYVELFYYHVFLSNSDSLFVGLPSLWAEEFGNWFRCTTP